MKTPATKNEPASKPASAEDCLVGILESALAFRGDKVNLATVARLANRASWLLKLSNEDRSQVENAAAIAVARRRGLIA